MNKALVLNIQKFSLHDGEGIRSTIFFKGCGLHCLWCHNPESQSYRPQLMKYDERCRRCGTCIKACPQNAISFGEDGVIQVLEDLCNGCGKCVDFCAYDALEIAGRYYSVDELVHEVKKDRILYEESNGGVTLSGGEVMSQSADFLLELTKKLNRIGIRVNIDTCGFAPWKNYETIAPYVDTFLYDIKMLHKEKHLFFIGEGLDRILDNLVKLNQIGANINIRIPIIGKVNDDLMEMRKMADLLVEHEIRVQQINLLPYHNTGSTKYERLAKEYKSELMCVPTDDMMNRIKEVFQQSGFNKVFIGG